VPQESYESAGDAGSDFVEADTSDTAVNEFWKERAGVREYLGRMDRKRAEYLAAIDTKREYGRVTDYIMEKIGFANGKAD